MFLCDRRFIRATIALDDTRACANVNLIEDHPDHQSFILKHMKIALAPSALASRRYCKRWNIERECHFAARVSFGMTVALARPSTFGYGAPQGIYNSEDFSTVYTLIGKCGLFPNKIAKKKYYNIISNKFIITDWILVALTS